MDMENRLTGVGIGIGDDPESRLRHPPLLGQLRRHQMDVADQLPILDPELETGVDMFAWNQEEVKGRLGVEILEGDNKVVFIDRLRGDGSVNYLAE